MRTVLLDGDTFIYESAAANEFEIQWDADFWTLHCEFDPTRAHLDSRIDRIMSDLKADHLVVALSDYTDPWRKTIMPSYKSNRRGVRKPVVYRALREYVHEVYRTFQRPGLEGDDVLGILLTSNNIIGGERVCVAVDKDMKTLPGLHVNDKFAREKCHRYEDALHLVTESQANYAHLYQTLTGDSTDGYSGCPGVGPKNAEKILHDVNLWGEDNATFDVKLAWEKVCAAFLKAGLGHEAALLNAQVARICRVTDYDFDNRRVIPWTPQ